MALSFEALRRVLQHVGHLLLLRADLAVEELAVLRRRWLGWAVMGLAGVALLAVALIAFGAWLTLLLWERWGPNTLGVLAVAFAIVGALVLRALAQSARQAPPALAQTRAAVHEDYEAVVAAAANRRDDVPPKT